MKDVEKIKPTGLFTNYIFKAIPLAFDESLSYYECLCGLLSYLKETVIPTVNNNADAIIEVQNLMTQLQNYVNNYFTNLDVQQEINNKLDEMVADGTLQEIIASYLNSKAIFGYDTVASMKQATNLINGSYAETLGYYEKNDGGGATYKITSEKSVTEYQEELVNGLYATLIIENEVNFKQFGAKGDGVTNDYQAVKKCCDHANTHNLLINNLDGNYYIDGAQILLKNSMENSDNVTFIVGDSYKKYNALFAFEHDSVSNNENVALSTVFSNKNTLTNEYKGKSFLLDTKIKYGKRLDGSDNDETIIEPFNCNEQYERLWFGEYDANLIVDVKNISNSNEKGYSFIGGKVEQKNTSGYGISFIKISRNNCVIKDIKINCESANGENAVIYVNNGNNCILDNIYCGSTRSNSSWGYDISLQDVANVKTSNITEVNRGTSFGNRTVKNWIIKDSNISVWDIHWNAFGFLTLENVNISGTIQIGYGTGILNIKNSYALWLETRNDYMQIFNGEIIVENSYLNDGVHIRSTYSNDNIRDNFFNNFKLPNLILKNSIKKYADNLQDLYINIPSEVADLITTKGRILFDNVDIMRVYYGQKSSATKKIYDSIIRDCLGFTSTIKEVLDSLGECIGVGSNTNNLPNVTPNTIFNNDFTSVCKRNGNVVYIRCEGTLNTNIVGTNYVLATLPDTLKPNEYAYGIITYDNVIIPCYINTQGKIYSKGNISSGTKIIISVNYILN